MADLYRIYTKNKFPDKINHKAFNSKVIDQNQFDFSAYFQHMNDWVFLSHLCKYIKNSSDKEGAGDRKICTLYLSNRSKTKINKEYFQGDSVLPPTLSIALRNNAELDLNNGCQYNL